VVLTFAPRLPARLRDEIARQSRRPVPIAEMNRRVGEVAVAMGLPRPSYERVRVLVHAAWRSAAQAQARIVTFAVGVALRLRPPRVVLFRLLVPRHRGPPG
jgi:hypothetical protein